jgi:hypothetical protein
VTLSGGLLGTAFFTEAAPATAAEKLIDSTIQAASHILSRNRAGVVSAEVATLTKQVLSAMLLTKVKVTATVLLTIGTLMAGAGVLARQETAPTRKEHVEPAAPASPLTAGDFDVVADQFLRQIRGTILDLQRESNPRNRELAANFRDQLNQVESDVRRAKEHLARWLGPDPAPSPPAKAGAAHDPRSSPAGKSTDPSSVVRQAWRDSGEEGQPGSDTLQPTFRAGGYIFTASPTGNRAIAYDPVTREVKSVQLNASKEHPLKITPRSGPRVELVALHLEGSKITRIAVFDLKSGRWLPTDLDEPVNGDVGPVYVGHSGTAYDLGRHLYTFNLEKGTWDHLDIQKISDDVEDGGAGDDSAGGRARQRVRPVDRAGPRQE